MRHGQRLKAGVLPAAAACIVSAGLLWGALTDRKTDMPDGWTPVNDRVEAALAGMDADRENAGDGGKEQAERQDGGIAASGKEVGAADASAVSASGSGGDGMTGAAGANDAAHAAGADSAGEAADAEDAERSGKLDLNAATADELDALPGIGPAKAQAIVADREANGPYQSVEQLTRVKGIGEKLLEKLRPHIYADR